MVFFTVYVHFAEEMFEMVSWTLQSLTQQHFLLRYLVYSGEKGRGRGKRNATLKPGSIFIQYQTTSEGILKAPLNGVYILKHLEIGRVISPIGVR